MSNLGKIGAEFFDSVIYPNLGADRDDVALGPRHGVDFGVIDVAGQAVVLSTDPVSILPELGFGRAGRLALDVVLSDVAVSGISPTHLAITLTLPPEMTDEELATTWRGLSSHARDLGVSITTGHTARYAGIDYSWVGGATTIGVGSRDDLVRPYGARPGDAIIVTTGPGAEVAGLFASLFPDQLELTESESRTARNRLDELGVVRDAATATGAGRVTAMHDATEGGLLGGLVEMARGAGVRFDVERDAAPDAPGVTPVTNAIDVDPWTVTSTGTLAITAHSEDADALVAALERSGTRAAVVGRVTEGDGVFLDDERVEAAEQDPSWAAFARLADDQL